MCSVFSNNVLCTFLYVYCKINVIPAFHILGVNSKKLMLWTVFVRHVAQSTKVVVQTIHTSPQNTSSLLNTTATTFCVNPNHTWKGVRKMLVLSQTKPNLVSCPDPTLSIGKGLVTEAWIFGLVEVLKLSVQSQAGQCWIMDLVTVLWVVQLKYLFLLPFLPINASLQFDWLLYTSRTSPRIWTHDTRPHLLAWAGWGLGTRLSQTKLLLRTSTNLAKSQTTAITQAAS